MPKFSGGVSICSKGYLVIKSGPCRDVRVHILVAEAMLGRKLRENEEVHHKDENKLNPHWTNLEVLDSVTHAGISNKKRWAHLYNEQREIEALEALYKEHEARKPAEEPVPF
jgi:hypothetical protein